MLLSCFPVYRQVSFEEDRIISQMNEYETLQIMMGDCRDILSGFQGGTLLNTCNNTRLLNYSSSRIIATQSTAKECV